MTSILVIDDDEVVTKTLNKVLEVNGYDVELANSGFEAIEKCKGRAFDVILSDIRMPKIDGIQTMKAINGRAKKRFMTGYPAEYINENIDFLQKPFGIKELLEHIQ